MTDSRPYPLDPGTGADALGHLFLQHEHRPVDPASGMDQLDDDLG
jgi:hypothetical protein